MDRNQQQQQQQQPSDPEEFPVGLTEQISAGCSQRLLTGGLPPPLGCNGTTHVLTSRAGSAAAAERMTAPFLIAAIQMLPKLAAGALQGRGRSYRLASLPWR
jgi:hypothetical protein